MQNGTLVVNPGQELKIPVSPPCRLNPNMVLELSVKVEKLPEKPGARRPRRRPGPRFPATGGIDFRGIHVESVPSRTPLPEWHAAEAARGTSPT